MLPDSAEMVTAPGAMAVIRPVLLMVATEGSEELQLTCSVTSKQVPSEYLAVAINCSLMPTGMLRISGVTDMEDRIAEFTVSAAVADKFPEVTVITALPGETALAKPPLSIITADESDELQITRVLISWFVSSVYVPVATARWLIPTGILTSGRVTDMEDRVAGYTVSVVLPDIFPEVAVMVVVPVVRTVARPLLSMVATDGSDELQLTWPRLWLDPSAFTPAAENCLVAPSGTLGPAGLILI
jgi:hypothetical protein